ncbi:MAG: riboflavin synthase [Verrucomicrobiae bacterium]|nr:riboflavin synthase [Verrucomicrobiae bacterium]
MFSGIVEGQGRLARIKPVAASFVIEVTHEGLGRGVKIGDSIAVNGCCLTVVGNRQGRFRFDILRETWNRTVFHACKTGQRVNLERSLRMGDRIGGHLVTGHIDGVGKLTRHEEKYPDVYVEIEPPSGFMRYIVMKGCVAIDGISLTVATVTRKSFGIWLIPHTLELTTLGWKRRHDLVNLEADMLAKYAQNTIPR